MTVMLTLSRSENVEEGIVRFEQIAEDAQACGVEEWAWNHVLKFYKFKQLDQNALDGSAVPSEADSNVPQAFHMEQTMSGTKEMETKTFGCNSCSHEYISHVLDHWIFSFGAVSSLIKNACLFRLRGFCWRSFWCGGSEKWTMLLVLMLFQLLLRISKYTRSFIDSHESFLIFIF